MNTFAQLFRRYRLRSEFVSLSDFADAFAERGQVYDTSIFSHWQKGSRVPSKRYVLIALIELFLDSGGIQSLEEANEFMESAGHGYLTDKEREKLFGEKPKITTGLKVSDYISGSNLQSSTRFKSLRRGWK